VLDDLPALFKMSILFLYEDPDSSVEVKGSIWTYYGGDVGACQACTFRDHTHYIVAASMGRMNAKDVLEARGLMQQQ